MAEKKELKKKTSEVKEATGARAAKEIDEVMGIKEVKEIKSAKTAEEFANSPAGNFVYIGKKGAMAYVLAVVTQFGMGAKTVTIKARGKSISRAVDVAEIVRNRDNTMKIENIGISTEEVITQDGRPLKISSIEILLTK